MQDLDNLQWELFPDWNNDLPYCTHGYSETSIASGNETAKAEVALNELTLSSAYNYEKCTYRLDEDCTKWFPFFYALSYLRKYNFICRRTIMTLHDFPNDMFAHEFKRQVGLVETSTTKCNHGSEDCIVEVNFHWRNRIREDSLWMEPDLSRIISGDIRDEWRKVRVFTSTKREFEERRDNFKHCESSYVFASIAEGPRTKTLCYISSSRLDERYSLSRTLGPGQVNWYDTRVRLSRMTGEHCRDCEMASIYCRMK